MFFAKIIFLGNFMYFPDNKLEYIPSLIQLVIFVFITFLVFRLIKRVSKKQELQAKQLEEQLLKTQNVDKTSE